jgi:hypothetical protein
MVPISERITQAFQDDHPDPISKNGALGARIKGATVTIG